MFEHLLAGLSDGDRAGLQPYITRAESIADDFSRADAEAASIVERYGDDAGTMPAGQAQRLENTRRRAKRLADELVDAEQAVERRAQTFGAVRSALRTGRGVEHIGDGPAVHSRNHGTPYAGLVPGAGLSDDSAAGLRSRAMDLAESIADVPQAARKFFAESVEADHDSNALLARWALATGRDAYRSAFAKLLADPVRGHMLWNDDERLAFQDVDVVSRAMGTGSGAAGGFMVPFFLDPAIMLTNSGVAGGLRPLVRQATTAGNDWHGVSSAGVTVEWLAESSEAADGSPTLAQPAVPLHKLSVFCPFSVEFETSADVGQLQAIMADAHDVEVAKVIATGSGTGQPTGVVTALSGSAIALGTAGTLAASDVTGLQNALGSRFQARAAFAANLATINELGAMETTNGALRFPEVADSRLLRRSLVEDSSLAAVGAGSGASIAYGDFQSGYVLATGVGTRAELVPHLLGANGRPTGERGFWLYARLGGDVVNSSAIKLLGA